MNRKQIRMAPPPFFPLALAPPLFRLMAQEKRKEKRRPSFLCEDRRIFFILFFFTKYFLLFHCLVPFSVSFFLCNDYNVDEIISSSIVSMNR